MNEKELKIRYTAKVKFWYQRFEALSDVIDKLQAGLERQKEIIEKVVCENTQLVIELRNLQQEKEEMKFDHVELESNNVL